ncbi:glycosyltransferase family 2 protein [Lachnospiraceae bacterium 42-17]|jgi:glycosyltransferase involved in cell wall biosynthesis|nr:glycosyltransferase family 2 protein [Dorea sp.]
MISVIIPVYNTEKYLRRCIDSVLASYYRDFEILLINDGSTDKSADICREYSLKDNRIKVFHQKNQGVSAARNQGINKAIGEWLIFVDSDDYITKDFLSVISCDRYKNIDFLLFDFIKSTDSPRKAASPVKPISIRNKGMLKLLQRILVPEKLSPDTNADFRSPCARAYKKSIIDQYSIRFSPGLTVGEDLLFNLEYQLRAGSCVYTPIPVYVYDIHTGSATHGFRGDLVKNHARLQKEIKNILIKSRMFPSLEREFYSYSLENLTYVLIWEVLSPLNPAPYREKKRLLRLMQKNPIYRKAMKYSLKTGILPRRILVLFFRLRCYLITDLICRVSFWYMG